MGVDALLYAVKSNTHYELDRDRNVKFAFWYSDHSSLIPKESEYLRSLNDSNGGPFTKQEMLFIIKMNIKIALGQIPDQEERSSYNQTVAIFHNAKMLVMVLNSPENEEFFIITDLNDEYFEIKEKSEEHFVKKW